MKVTIYRLVRDPKAHHRVLGKDTLRVVNVHPTFEGIGEHGEHNRAAFKALSDSLEPGNDGFTLS
jgi:hypothetical protein